MDGVSYFQILLIVIVCGVIFILLRLRHGYKLENRLGRYAIATKTQDAVSLVDRIYGIVWVVIQKMTKILNKSVVFSKYGDKYSKFIVYEERNKKVGLDYVSGKVLLAINGGVLLLGTSILKGLKIDFIIYIIVMGVLFFLPDIYLNIKYYHKRKRIEDDLLNAIIIMNNAFKSGRNIMQAIECVNEQLEGPVQDEFKKIYLDITYGLSLDVVFNRFYQRVRLEDAKYITSSLTLLNKTGGDIIKVFSMIEKSIFDKKNLKNELKSLTASSSLVFKMLAVLPFVFGLIILVLNPNYFTVFLTTPLGIITLILIGLLYILYILVIRKVLEVQI